MFDRTLFFISLTIVFIVGVPCIVYIVMNEGVLSWAFWIVLVAMAFGVWQMYFLTDFHDEDDDQGAS